MIFSLFIGYELDSFKDLAVLFTYMKAIINFNGRPEVVETFSVTHRVALTASVYSGSGTLQSLSSLFPFIFCSLGFFSSYQQLHFVVYCCRMLSERLLPVLVS